MYKIIGGDGNEYGPVSAEQLHQWIAEGRANNQTKVQREGEPEWKPLAAFPEFAEALMAQARAQLGAAAATTTPPPFSSATAASAGDGREAALRAVSGPATALKVTAILGLICAGLGLVINVMVLAGYQFDFQQMPDPQMQKLFDRLGGGLGIFQGLMGVVMGIVILKGAAKMQALQNHQFAFIASILAMLPCVSPCCFLGLPFGIWALVVLNRPEVKSQFN